jgi:hypothetical protein
MAYDRRAPPTDATSRNPVIAVVVLPVGVAGRVGSALLRRPMAELESFAVRIAERAIENALSASLPEVLTRMLVEHRVIERVAAELAADGTLERLLDESLQSRFAHSAAARLGESEDVLLLVDAIARSEQVRQALQAQSTGLAEELADEARARTTRVDDALERGARALLRRPRRPPPVVDLPTDGLE